MTNPLTHIVATLFLSAALPAFACEGLDSDFMAFFNRFSNEPRFQDQRFAEVIRFGRFRGEEGQERMTWQDYSPEKIRRTYGATLVPGAEERESKYLMMLGPAYAKHRTVLLTRKESDSHEVTLFFTKRKGCWWLYGVQDTSNVHWVK